MYGIAYSRDQLLSLRWAQPPSASSSRVRLMNVPITTRVRKCGCRGGRRRRLPAPTYTVIEGTGCSVISGNRPAHSSVIHRPQTPISSTTRAVRVLSNVPPPRYVHQTAEQIHCGTIHPSLFLINPTSIAKPHAIDHLRADLAAFGPDIVVISESWLKPHHKDDMMRVEGYELFWRDRFRRMGGGVAVYCRKKYRAAIYHPRTAYYKNVELMWLSIQANDRTYFLGALYHPPNPLYDKDILAECLQATIDELHHQNGDYSVILAGDFNQFSHSSVLSMGFEAAYVGPTHEGHALDRVYTSEPLYSSCVAVKSTIKTKHLAVMASTIAVLRPESMIMQEDKSTHYYRLRTPTRIASLLKHLSSQTWEVVEEAASTEESFESFYSIIHSAIDKFFPMQHITIRRKEPAFMTPFIKVLIRRRNKLLKRGRHEAAAAVSVRINSCIARRNAVSFDGLERGSRKLWTEVNRLRRPLNDTHGCGGLTADDLNRHYAALSTDHQYVRPSRKVTVTDTSNDVFSSLEVFNHLYTLVNTSSGPDEVPPRVLRLASPFIAKPVAYLFNQSLFHSVVPHQLKRSVITPVAKVALPSEGGDFWPISVTPILGRMMEKLVTKHFYYPMLDHPQQRQHFSDQFAFRPTGSTTVALIAITQTVSEILTKEPMST